MNYGNEPGSLTFTAEITSPSNQAILGGEEQIRSRYFQHSSTLQKKTQNTQNSSTTVDTILQIHTQSVFVSNKGEQTPLKNKNANLLKDKDEFQMHSQIQNKPYLSFRPDGKYFRIKLFFTFNL